MAAAAGSAGNSTEIAKAKSNFFFLHEALKIEVTPQLPQAAKVDILQASIREELEEAGTRSIPFSGADRAGS